MAMQIRRPLLLLAALVVLSNTGCAWLKNRRPAARSERDPLLMSHLTHGKSDPLFASTENDLNVDNPTRFASSVSRKPGSYMDQADLGDTQRQAERRRREHACCHADDYRWIIGQLQYRPEAGWSVRYAPPGQDKRFDGEIGLTRSFQPGLIRVGERVLVEGRVVHVGIDGYRFKVEAIELISQ